MEDLIRMLAVWSLPVILAITLHEAAHGYAARFFGDPTAANAGRVSLNPLRHVDVLGTLVVPGAILAVRSFFGGAPILFGWAKPVPVAYTSLRRPRRDLVIVAGAGPAANLVLAVVFALLHGAAARWPLAGTGEAVLQVLSAGVYANLWLLALNLLPLPPLDGGRIVCGLLPVSQTPRRSLEFYGIAVLLLLLVTDLLPQLLVPLVRGGMRALELLVAMPIPFPAL
jgi:Zn-dependent protease